MPNPRANRPLTLDQVTADLKSLSQPAFYPRVGNIQARGMRSPQPQPMREQTGPEMPQWGDSDLSVPTQANRAMSQRLSEQDVLERSRANANMSPLEKAGAAMQAARLAGSGLTQLALSMPTRIRSGDQAADEYIAENIYQPTIPKATEYVSDLGEMLEQLETRYKLPPIMPELLAFQEMAGPAARQVAKTGAKAGRAAGSSAAQMFDQSMRMAPEGQAIDQGFAGGGLLKGIKAARKGALNAERSMPARGALSFADEPMAGPSVIKEKGGNWLSGGVERAVKPLKRRVETENIANYTPEQIKRLMESGSLPRNDALNKWIDRNLTNYIKKEMATPEDPVRRLAEEGITHMPANEIDFANAFLPEKLALKRMNAGFPTQDLGKSPAAQGWERITDELVNVAPASEHTRPLTPSEIRQGVKSTTEADPWLNKVDPNTPIYYPENMDSLARDLGFDHIVDVLKEDLATGRIRPEQLSKVSMEQAVRRTHEYDQELAAKMNADRAAKREGLPVHKEYPEGYRWVELNKPGAFASESEAMGHSVRGYEPPRGHPDWAEGSGESGSSGYGHGGWEAIKSGKAKVYSLVDPKGEPHVTVEVGRGAHPIGYSYFGGRDNFPDKFDYNLNFEDDFPRIDESQKQAILNRAKELHLENPSNERMDVFQMAADEVLGKLPPKITQIKGKGNAKPKEEYLPFVQDFVKGGKWSDVGDLQNTQLTHIEDVPEVKQYRAAGMELPSYVTDKERDDLIYEYLKKTRPASDPDFMQSEYGFPPPEDGMKHGGSVHISDNPDTMMMELGDKHFALGGLSKASKAVAKAAKPNLVIKSKPGIIVTNLIDEEPDIAKRLGAEARAKRQAAIEAEGQRKQLAAQTQPSVGYRPSTPQKPDPLVGTRFVNEPEFGLNPNEPFDIAKFKGGSGMVLPWDSQSRNVKTTQVSGVDLPNQIFDVTHGGIPYAFDTAHVKKGIAGASGEDISKRIKTRADTAVGESIGRGGTGELLHFPITMGFRAEDYALPYSEFSFDIINHKLMTGELTPKEVDELTKMVRNFEPPKYKGKKPFAEFAGFNSPEGLDQIYTGEGLKVPPGELRKAIADRMIWQKGSQEKLGFNAEDLMNATTYEPLRGVDKGYIGSTVMRNSPGGMRLSPSAGKYPYDTDFSGEHLGRLEDLIDVEALFHRTLNPIKRELITRENLKPYNKESLRNAAIGAIEKRNEGISQSIDQQFLDDYADYLNEMKKPHEYRKGGAITVKPKKDGQKFKPGKKPDQILKHGQAMPRGKDPEVDISQMAPMMMAGGGEVNADDLILEERPL
jgi:hypothetical protein